MAVVFVVVIFFLKTPSFFNNKETYQSTSQENGLTYNNVAIKDLVNRDMDGDGILDWEEGLYGLDPTKKETSPGIPDSVAIEKLRNQTAQGENLKSLSITEEKLTQTDKFARELFSTVATLNQNGTMDQAAIDQLSSALADHIQNSKPRKVYTLNDIKIIKNDLLETISNYINTINDIYQKNPIKNSVPDILHKFAPDENTVNIDALKELDPIIKQTNKIISEMAQMSVPQFFASLHINFLNALERISENMEDMKLYDSDTIVALGGMSQYQNNIIFLDSVLESFSSAVKQKLNN